MTPAESAERTSQAYQLDQLSDMLRLAAQDADAASAVCHEMKRSLDDHRDELIAAAVDASAAWRHAHRAASTLARLAAEVRP